MLKKPPGTIAQCHELQIENSTVGQCCKTDLHGLQDGSYAAAHFFRCVAHGIMHYIAESD